MISIHQYIGDGTSRTAENAYENRSKLAAEMLKELESQNQNYGKWILTILNLYTYL